MVALPLRSPEDLLALRAELLALRASMLVTSPRNPIPPLLHELLELSADTFGLLEQLRRALGAEAFSKLSTGLEVGSLAVLSGQDVLLKGHSERRALLSGLLATGLATAGSLSLLEAFRQQLEGILFGALPKTQDHLWAIATMARPQRSAEELDAVRQLIDTAIDGLTDEGVKVQHRAAQLVHLQLGMVHLCRALLGRALLSDDGAPADGRKGA